MYAMSGRVKLCKPCRDIYFVIRLVMRLVSQVGLARSCRGALWPERFTPKDPRGTVAQIGQIHIVGVRAGGASTGRG